MKLLPAQTSASLIDAVHHADIFALCERVYRAGVLVDMILCDLPYGTTACAWDTVIPFEPMWYWFKRIIKPRGAIVLTASQPFTSALVMSNPRMFKYSWVWVKSRPTDFVNSNNKPMKRHEDVLIFSDGDTANGAANKMRYYPQGLIQHSRKITRSSRGYTGERQNQSDDYISNLTNYPDTVLPYPSEGNTKHLTQKPVALFDYLIRTYTQVGDVVFDPTAGSGTTAVAARGCNRRYIVGDSSAEYVEVMRKRLAAPYQLSLLDHTILEASAQETL